MSQDFNDGTEPITAAKEFVQKLDPQEYGKYTERLDKPEDESIEGILEEALKQYINNIQPQNRMFATALANAGEDLDKLLEIAKKLSPKEQSKAQAQNPVRSPKFKAKMAALEAAQAGKKPEEQNTPAPNRGKPQIAPKPNYLQAAANLTAWLDQYQNGGLIDPTTERKEAFVQALDYYKGLKANAPVLQHLTTESKAKWDEIRLLEAAKELQAADMGQHEPNQEAVINTGNNTSQNTVKIEDAQQWLNEHWNNRAVMMTSINVLAKIEDKEKLKQILELRNSENGIGFATIATGLLTDKTLNHNELRDLANALTKFKEIAAPTITKAYDLKEAERTIESAKQIRDTIQKGEKVNPALVGTILTLDISFGKSLKEFETSQSPSNAEKLINAAKNPQIEALLSGLSNQLEEKKYAHLARLFNSNTEVSKEVSEKKPKGTLSRLAAVFKFHNKRDNNKINNKMKQVEEAYKRKRTFSNVSRNSDISI